MVDPLGRDRLPPGWPLIEGQAQASTAIYRAVEPPPGQSKMVISLSELTDAAKAATSGEGGPIDLYA